MKKMLLLGLALPVLGACQPIQEGRSVAEVERVLEKAQQQQVYNSMLYIDNKALIQAAQKQDALSAQERGKLSLAGLGIVVKDNIHVVGMPHTAGTAGLRDFVPKSDAAVVTRLKDAGALIVGKSNLHELAYGITSNNYFTGPVRNPANVDYFAGGSSGGTAAAIAAGIVKAGIGTDTGGSTRIPAALTGVVGFRPSMGRYPNSGLTMISDTRDTVGPMAIDVTTVARLDAVLAEEADAELSVPAAKTIRLGVARDYFFQNLEPEMSKGIERALKLLSNAGVELVEISASELAALNNRVSFPVVLYETSQLLPRYLQKNDIPVTAQALVAAIESPDVKAVVGEALAGAINKDQYQEAINVHRPALQSYYQQLFKQHKLDALVFPTTPLTARPIKDSEQSVRATESATDDSQLPTFASYIQNTDPASNVGSPGVSLPMGRSAMGLPMGLELDGPINSDRRLLAIAARLESILASLNK